VRSALSFTDRPASHLQVPRGVLRLKVSLLGVISQRFGLAANVLKIFPAFHLQVDLQYSIVLLTLSAPKHGRNCRLHLQNRFLTNSYTHATYVVFKVFHIRALHYTKTLITNKCTKRVLSSIVTHSYMFRPCWVIFRENFLLSLH
jgi:hypothetical protein